MLEFQPRKDVTAWELCQVFRLTGSIMPGVQGVSSGTHVHTMQLEGKGLLMRHFVCLYADVWRRIEEAVDCQECEYCDWVGLIEEWQVEQEKML